MYSFKLSAPDVVQIDPVHTDIRVPPILQKTVVLIPDVDICFLVQPLMVERGFAVSEGSSDVLYTPGACAG